MAGSVPAMLRNYGRGDAAKPTGTEPLERILMRTAPHFMAIPMHCIGDSRRRPPCASTAIVAAARRHSLFRLSIVRWRRLICALRIAFLFFLDLGIFLRHQIHCNGGRSKGNR